MGSVGFQMQLCCCSMAMAGMRISSHAATAGGGAWAAPSRGQLRSSLGGGSASIVSSRRLFMRTALLGFLTPGMLSTPPPALARSRVSAIPEVLKNVEWPESFPFKQEDFQRYDESSDKIFYDNPRFVTHIDDPAIKALTQYYASVFPPANTPGIAVLDLCSSWVSHYPKNYRQEKIVGMGMNEAELKRNEVLTDYVVQDLNVDPKLPFEDNSFDVITNAVSVDYLTKPLQMFIEMNRVLKPGGLAAMSFSNRCFFTKAISIWTSTGDADHVWIVGSYFHYAGGFEPPEALDISPEIGHLSKLGFLWRVWRGLIDLFAVVLQALDISANPGRSDPMYVVFAKKSSA